MMARKARKAQRFTCERCGADAGTGGVHCDPCGLALVRGLLGSAAWCANAATRSGDLPGETMVDTMRRELRALEAVVR